MRTLWLLAGLLSLTSCGGQLVRDSRTYQVEVTFLTMAAMQQADLLKGFISTNCVCTSDKQFTTAQCQKAAKTVQVIQSRIPWHKAMMLYNGGLTETRPPIEPPAVPPPSELCPQ